MGYSSLVIKTEVERLEMYNFLGETIANLSHGILTFKPQEALEFVRLYGPIDGAVLVPFVDFVERLGLKDFWLGYFARYLGVKKLPSGGATLSIEMYLEFEHPEKIRKNFGFVPNYAVKIIHGCKLIHGCYRERNQVSDGTFMKKVADELTKKYGDKITNLALYYNLGFIPEGVEIEILK